MAVNNVVNKKEDKSTSNPVVVEVLEGLKNVLFSGDNLPYCFYGIYTRLGMAISMEGKLQLHIAKKKDDVGKGKPQKGVPQYDNENRVNFTLSANECFHIVNNIKEVINGTYSDPDPRCDPKYKSTLKIVHYPSEGAVSRLTLQQDAKDPDALKLTISVPGSEPLSFILSYNKDKGRYERSVFLSVVENVAKTGPYNTQLFKSYVTILRGMLMTHLNKEDNNGNGYQKKSYNNYSSNYSKNEEEFEESNYITNNDNSDSSEIEDDIPF